MATAPTTALDDTDEHSTTALFRAAIGGISNNYYLPRFLRFESADRPGLSWNWAAAANTLNWLMFRQLWHAALVYSGTIVSLAVLLFGIGKLVFQFSDGTQWGLLVTLLALAFVVPGLGGNALYYLATRQRVQNALAKNQTVPEACAQLGKQASTRKGLIIIAACNAAVLAVGAQSYAMFSGFEPLPVGTPVAASAALEGRQVASGRAVDATQEAPVAPVASASAPQAPASSVPTPTLALAPAPAASAPSSAPALPGSARDAAKRAASAPAVPRPASASSDSARPLPPVKTASAPQPVPLRSAAAVNAARDVAAALGQTPPAPQGPDTAPAQGTTPDANTRFVVNVGLFADTNNARNALVKLMDAELPVVSKDIRFPKGNRTRVQVGPFETLAEADAAADKVRALELEARVAPVP